MTSSQPNAVNNSPLTLKKTLTTWLPLVASWMLMSFEFPTVNAVIARLANPEVNLAAYGGVSFSIALTIEAPVIMLLAASTALSRDWESYRKLQKFSVWLGAFLSGLTFIVAVSPLYDFIVRSLLQVPEEVIAPGRLGLLFLTPWTFAIAYRRFQHGTMIRFGHSKIVGQTTLARLITVTIVLTIGLTTRALPGALLAGLAQGLGVSVEAIYAGFRIRKIYPEIKAAPRTPQILTLKNFLKFYLPLALTSSLWLLWQPLISGAVSRMPDPLSSLAVWSVVTGLLFMMRAPGVAFNEAVVALLEESDSYRVLRKFALIMSVAITIVSLGFIASPLSHLWFDKIAKISPDKIQVARVALGLGLPLGVLSMYISLFQGIIVSGRKTGVIAESVSLFLVTMGGILILGVVNQGYKGVYVASASFSVAHFAQLIWLLVRSRKKRKNLLVNG